MLGSPTNDGGNVARPARVLLPLLPLALALLAPRLGAIDQDTNGVSDVWAAFYGVTNMAPGDDPDGDGKDNLSESIAGTGPLDPLSRFASIATTDQTNLWVEWFGVAGKRYEAWYSYDLMEWELFDGPFTGTGTNLSVGDGLPSAGEGEMMMSSPDPLAESLAALEANGISPTIQPEAGTPTAAGTKTTFSLHFVSAIDFENGLTSMVFWDIRDDGVCLHHYRILSNIPLGRLPTPQQWFDKDAGWGVVFLNFPYRWKDAVWYYDLQDPDALEKKLLESKGFTWVSEPFDRFAAYEPPSGWVLDYIQWLHRYFGDNIDRFAAEIVARDNELAGIEDPAAFELAMAAPEEGGGGMMTLSLEPDGIRKFYRVQTIASIDFEGDGLDAYEEGLLGTSDSSADSDGDGVADGIEFSGGLHPTNNVDSDADGMPDDWESYHFGSLERSTAPTVAWMSPTNGAAIATGTETYLAASVTDNEVVTRVDFFADGTNVGQDATYPYAVAWSNAVPGAHSLHALAVFGQGATTGSAPVSVTIFDPDPDGDGSPDDWESQWFGSTTNPGAIASADPDGDGFTNGFERLEGTSPLDYFNGDLPEMEIVGGDMQGAPTNAFLAESLAVRLTRPSGLVYSNAPVTFSAPAGGLAETNGGSTFLSLDVRADANGIARAWYRTPSSASTNAITATASNATTAASNLFTAFAGAGKPTLSVLAPDNVASEPGINRGLFHVIRTGNPWVGVTAQLGISGTASNGLDYDALPTNLLLSAGLLTGAIEVVVRDDTNAEAPETVVLRLLTNSAYDVGSPASNTVTVADNDSGGGTTAIEGGDNFSAAVMYDGSVWTWGSDASGQLGNGGTGSTNRPAPGPGLAGVKDISCGALHMLALMSNGVVKAWGDGGDGQLGDNNNSTRQTPVSVVNLTNVISVSAGNAHSLALSSNGSVWAWGSNEEGGLGIGSTLDNFDTPQATTLTSSGKSVSAGRRNSYALQGTTLKGCGNNNSNSNPKKPGQLGFDPNDLGNTNRFVTIPGLPSALAAASGYEFVIAIVGTNAWAWGDNSNGQLGVPKDTFSWTNTPRQVAGIAGVKTIAAGDDHCLALKETGTVWAWGRGSYGQLGHGSKPGEQSTPVQASAPGFSNVIAIAAGKNHSMALDKQGWIWVWGANGDGQLGLGDNDDRDTPTRIETLNLLSYPPSVQITSPADGLSLTNAAGRMALAATAEDPDGSIARVDFFYQDTNLIGSDTSAPFTATWTNLPIGTWTFTAKATDNKGVAATSAPVSVTILSDDDGMGDAWEQAWFGNLDQDPEGDADNDGLTNEQEETHGTQPGYFDSDGDFLGDGFEVAHGMLPTSFDNPNADPDGDGLTNLQEIIYGTDPTDRDSDNDGIDDGPEAASGGNPTDPSDNGQAPPAEELVTVNLEIGDDSGSHSERYEMTVTPTGGAPGPTIRHQWNVYGELSPPTAYRFRKGFAYQVTVQHLGTRGDYKDEPKPDYDYTARISPVPGEPQQFIVDDPEGILGEHGESGYFFAAGKSATLIVPRADLDLMRISHNCAAGELPEGHEVTPGAFVPINNDDDDYDSSNTPDKDQAGAVTGESDLLPVLLHKVEPSRPGSKYTLDVPSHIRLWLNNDRTGAVNGTTEIDANSDTTLYVEGILPGSGTIKINWKSSAANIDDCDQIKLTAFNWLGPLDVPGCAIHRYTASGALGSSMWIAPIGGSLQTGSGTSTITVLWDPGPVVGKAVFQASADYIWDLEVNVVRLLVEPPDAGPPFDRNSPYDLGNFPGAAGDLEKSVKAGTPFGVDWRAKVTLNGPNGHRGVKSMRVGFIQNLRQERERGIYTTENKTLRSSIEGNVYLDYADGSAPPYYSDTGDAVFFDPSPTRLSKVIESSDSPAGAVPITFDQGASVDPGDDVLDVIDIDWRFTLYVTVRTVDTRNDAQTKYTCRARADWAFNGWGTVSQTAPWPWSDGSSTGNTIPSDWTDVGDGSEPAVKSGTQANAAVQGETFSVLP